MRPGQSGRAAPPEPGDYLIEIVVTLLSRPTFEAIAARRRKAVQP